LNSKRTEDDFLASKSYLNTFSRRGERIYYQIRASGGISGGPIFIDGKYIGMASGYSKIDGSFGTIVA
jgi:hypothetical protein